MTSVAETADAPQQPARRRRSTAEHGTRLPEDWRRSEADIAWQHGEKIPDAFARLSTQAFKNYWLSKPGSAAKKLDWSRTWRTWILRDWIGLSERKREEWRQLDAERRSPQPARSAVPEALR